MDYLPLLVFMILALAVGVFPMVLAKWIAPSSNVPAKYEPYECGFKPYESARVPFDVRYYLVAILFIIFDLETAFLFPWAIEFRRLSVWGAVSMGFFLMVLVVGFIYEWRKGALQWQ